MSVSEQMKNKLTTAFSPTYLDIRDESHKHIGHAGHDGRGESHFHITITATAFSGKTRLEKQRMVHAVLAEEMKNRVHALSLKIEGN